MTRTACLLLALTCVLALAGAQVPTTPAGTWRQYDDKKGDLRSIIRLDIAGSELTGTIVETFPRPGEAPHTTCDKCPGEFKDKPIVGLRFLWGLRGSGREWEGGRVLDPEEGKIYKVKLKLSEDGGTLDVRGYIGFSLLGRTQQWKRTEARAQD